MNAGVVTTAMTARLAWHAASIGADGVAAIAPPYFSYSDEELLEHFAVTAAAYFPLLFYVYEFAARSGYMAPVAVIERPRDRAPQSAGTEGV